MNKYFLLLLLAATAFQSCKKMDDIYREFYESGETVYVGKADSIKVRGGNERVELTWLLLSDPKVASYKVYWNNKNDSVQNTVNKTANVDTVRLMLNDMPEDVYMFEIYLFDKDNNSSILSSVVGKSYGAFYQNSILNRTYKSSRRIAAGAEVTWTAAAEDLLFVDLSYTDKNGNSISKLIPRTVDVDTLRDIPVRGTFRFRSAYIPEPNALDTFYTSYRTATLTN